MAARIERAEAGVVREFAERARAGGRDVLIEPLGGTTAVYGGPGEPFNKVAGLGFAPGVDDESLARLEAAYDARHGLRRLRTGKGAGLYFARRDGEVAGVAYARIADGLLQLAGATTLPAHRRRGIQSALLRARLVEAAASGCDLAVVTVEPASKSQQNVRRAGFALLYPRAVLVRRAGVDLQT